MEIATKDELINQLMQDDALDSLFSQMQQLCQENLELKTQILSEQTKSLELEQQLTLQSSQLDLFNITIEQESKTIQQEVKGEFQEKVNLLNTQVENMDYQLSEAQSTIETLNTSLENYKVYVDSAKQAYSHRLNQLYMQLVKYQKQDSLRTAKAQLERNSRAYITLDKLGSQFHLDTLQTNLSRGGLSNVTATTQAFAVKGEASEVLCTRDQVRLTVSGKLFEMKSLGDVRWYRSQSGSAFTQIPNAGGRARADATVEDTYGLGMTYIPTVDDLHCTLRCQFVDPNSGATLVAEIGPVVPDKELLESAVEAYKKNEFEITVGVAESDVDLLLLKEKEWEKLLKTNKDLTTSQQKPNFLESLGMGGGGGMMSEFKLTISSKKIVIAGKRNGKKVSTKITLDSTVYIAAHSDTETGFSLYLFNNWINCNAPNRHQRDVILALTRLFIQQTRINEISNDSERHREKQYSSAWMLTLINSDHDVLTAMPKSKIHGSQPLSIFQEDLNVGDILIGPKLSQCDYETDEVFLDVLQTQFEVISDVLPVFHDGSDENSNPNDRDNNNNNNRSPHENSGIEDDNGHDYNQHQNQSNHIELDGFTEHDETPTKSTNTLNSPSSPLPPTPIQTIPDTPSQQQPLCVWVTRSQFEQNALLHTQFATIDFSADRQQQQQNRMRFLGQREAPTVALSLGSRASFSMNSSIGTNGGVMNHSSASVPQQQGHQQRFSQTPQNSPQADAISFKQPKQSSTATFQSNDEYVPYDIDDVTPQLGGGRRGFDDIIIGGDSDSDDDNNSTQQRRRSVIGTDGEMTQQDHYGAPAFELKIKKADEVVVDNEASAAKIKQIFSSSTALNDSSLGLGKPTVSVVVGTPGAGSGPNGSATMARMGRRQQIGTMKRDGHSLASPTSTTSQTSMTFNASAHTHENNSVGDTPSNNTVALAPVSNPDEEPTQ